MLDQKRHDWLRDKVRQADERKPQPTAAVNNTTAGRLQAVARGRGEQPARLATLNVRFRQVTLAAPASKAGQLPLTLWTIEAGENRPPKGVAPIR